MKLPVLFTLLAFFLRYAVGIPLATSSQHHIAKRALKLGDDGQLLNPRPGENLLPGLQKAMVSQGKLKEEIFKKKEVQYSSKVVPYYRYDDLAKNGSPQPVTWRFFWPIQENQNQIAERKKEMKAKLQELSPEYPQLPRVFKSSGVTAGSVKRIVCFGLGSFQALHVTIPPSTVGTGQTADSFAALIKKYEEVDHPNERERSFRGLALALAVQNELANKPELIFQDPAYSEAEEEFMRDSGQNVKVLGDPDAFAQIDENTIVLNFVGLSGFWYKINEGTKPLAIISDKFGLAPEDMTSKYQRGGVLQLKDEKNGGSLSRLANILLWVRQGIEC